MGEKICRDMTFVAEIKRALKAVLPNLIPKLVSTKFILCLGVIIGGLVRGGPEGFAAVIAALGYYCGTKAYQNVQFAKLNGNTLDPLKSLANLAHVKALEKLIDDLSKTK